MKNTFLFAIVVVLASASGFAFQRYLAQEKNADELPTHPILNTPDVPVIGQPRPDIVMRDLEGNMRNLNEWNDHVILVNFWATWCPPCMKEIPLLVKLQEQYTEQGFQIIGVAVDNVEAINQFANEMGINYPILPGDLGAIEISRQYGNRIGGLPYSVFISRAGIVTHTTTGELHREQAETALKELGINIDI